MIAPVNVRIRHDKTVRKFSEAEFEFINQKGDFESSRLTSLMISWTSVGSITEARAAPSFGTFYDLKISSR